MLSFPAAQSLVRHSPRHMALSPLIGWAFRDGLVSKMFPTSAPVLIVPSATFPPRFQEVVDVLKILIARMHAQPGIKNLSGPNSKEVPASPLVDSTATATGCSSCRGRRSHKSAPPELAELKLPTISARTSLSVVLITQALRARLSH